MEYLKVPLSYVNAESLELERTVDDKTKMIDSLIDLIVFTPKGSCHADSDFGFEFWNYEYSNVSMRDFNNGQNGTFMNGVYNEITRKECQDSIKKSLEAYDSLLKHVDVTIELHSIEPEKRKKVLSRFQVVVKVSGMLDDGLGTFMPYNKEISFFDGLSR